MQGRTGVVGVEWRMTGELMATLLLIGSASQSDKSIIPQTIDAVVRCRGIAADAERLRCMDAAVDRMEAARTSGDLIVLDREKVAERRKAQFGLASDGELTPGAPAITEVTTTISSVGPSPTYGRYQIAVATGQVWETIGTVRFRPKIGGSVTLRTATLGGFRADLGREVVAVKRVK